MYNLKQRGTSINEYYTKMIGIWEELSAMNDLPRFTNVNMKKLLISCMFDQAK